MMICDEHNTIADVFGSRNKQKARQEKKEKKNRTNFMQRKIRANVSTSTGASRRVDDRTACLAFEFDLP